MLKPIINTKKGEQFAIQCLGCSCEEACQLQQLGCVEGVTGKVISNYSRVILEIGNTRLAISKDLAKSILVTTT
ncbi:MAG: ferrous iron transport protein A [Balneolaceae bacterium]|nr:ferrous iron transport protein A [Balneolaceae bacterium]